jgi:hypothetical protein
MGKLNHHCNPQKTKFPFVVHLVADARTWVELEWSSAALMVAQMSAGDGLRPSGQVKSATTRR